MNDNVEEYTERVWKRLKHMLPPSKTLQVELRAAPEENLRKARKALGMPERTK